MLHVEGLVSADGENAKNNVDGGGAGGSIHVHAAILEGSGTFQVSQPTMELKCLLGHLMIYLCFNLMCRAQTVELV